MRPLQAPVTRRRFLLGAGALAASAALPAVMFARTGGPARLVVVILRGALDGLAAVPPHGDPHYASLASRIGDRRARRRRWRAGTDCMFRFTSVARFLHERYLAGELIVFHAVASPYRDRRISMVKTCWRTGWPTLG